MKDSGWIQLIVMAVVLVASLLGPLVERARRRRMAARGEKPQGPEPEEPKLPYEDMVDEVFGPYMERRRQAYEARRAAAAEAEAEGEVAEEVEEEVEESPRRETRIRRIVVVPEERAAAPAVEEVPAEPIPAVIEAPAYRPSLDDRLFRNSRLSAGAKLVLAAEILGRPRSVRRR